MQVLYLFLENQENRAQALVRDHWVLVSIWVLVLISVLVLIWVLVSIWFLVSVWGLVSIYVLRLLCMVFQGLQEWTL